MGIVARARAFVESIHAIVRRSETERRRCPACGSSWVYRHGRYCRRAVTLGGRQSIAIQRYRCQECGATHSDAHPDLIPGGHYSRSVRRCAIDQWLHTGSSLRRVAEWMRSSIGHQERWLLWHVVPTTLDGSPGVARAHCTLSASTLCRWLNQAGVCAEDQVVGLYEGVPSSGLMGADGLWARLRGGTVRVLLMLRDSVTGLLWPPLVATGEEAAVAWEGLLARAQQAGLVLADVRALVSDGAQGLLSYLRQAVPWVYQQRCIFHTWRNLGGEMARQAASAAEGLSGEEGRAARARVQRELTNLVHAVLDAPGPEEAEEALAVLRTHPQGTRLWQVLNARFIELLTHRMAGREGVGRVTPEWCWRDLRLRLSRGRNQGSAERLQRMGTVFTIYHNFTPAQMRRERTRRYLYPGQSALEVAEIDMEGCSYLDILQV